ncbi:hypothetical protein [Pasteurella multocida]|uniref:hypothetical protein n=1 Tax=Pasteurella multocida TaxID=747 RepID=UPI00064C8207|nr:hypothetical protein [Pasteurella multocida]KLT48631.1 hypothetical protein PVACC_02600 [Pasteurella multocida subsp. multocida]KLT52947.1 hypothetical protein PMMV1_02600 [Pasteurella multocida subsp. multocida]KLT58310.1 hypothetical protein ISLM_02595 [Pasteurella multocida subsp. multocida]KLT62950.1 hypothetical protein PESH_02600 [Pasteurella multocida subsp. multocida]KLU28328.1 hypothetical protein ATTK_11250 [Pasteurella multocida subsp. multocida]
MGILNSMSESLNKKNNLSSTQPKPPTLSTQTPPQNDQQTMASNVANNLNANSLLMNTAAARGERMAASRGLQNSTLGIEASQRAMIDAAMPIAQVDTANQHQFNLQRDQQNFTANQANLDREHQKDVARLNAELAHNNAMKELGAQVSANTIGKSIDFMMQITSNFDAQIAAVQNNTQMAEKDKAIAIQNLINSRNSEVSFVTEFFNKIPTAKKDWHYFPSLGVPEVLIKPFEINRR